MASMVVLSNEALIKQFVKNVRNIVWWNIFGYYLDRSFQFFAGITFLLGMINLFFYPFPKDYCLLLALCCFLLGFIFSVQKRPTIIETAHYIDKQFNGQSLMITAIELLSSTGKEEPKFKLWVLHQAGQACIKWKPQTKYINGYRPNNLTGLAGGGLLLGVFFILQPGRSIFVDTIISSSYVQKTTASKSTDSASLFTTLREKSRASVTTAISSSGGDDSLTIANKQGIVKKHILEINKSKDGLNEVNQLNSKLLDIPVGLSQKSRHNIDGIGSQADNAPFSSKDNEITNLQLKLVKIALPSNDITYSEKSGLPFLRQEYVNNREFTKPVLNDRKQIIKMRYKSDFSSLQQQYITAYFNKRHEQK